MPSILQIGVFILAILASTLSKTATWRQRELSVSPMMGDPGIEVLQVAKRC